MTSPTAMMPLLALQVTVALSAPMTSYSNDPRKAMLEPPELMVGAGIALVAAVQVCPGA